MKPNRLTGNAVIGQFWQLSPSIISAIWTHVGKSCDWLQVMLYFTEPYVFIYVLWHHREVTKKQLITAIISQDCNSTNVLNNDSQVEKMKKRSILLWYHSYCEVTIFHLLSNEELPKYTEQDGSSIHLCCNFFSLSDVHIRDNPALRCWCAYILSWL